MSEHTKPEDMTEFEKVDCIYRLKAELEDVQTAYYELRLLADGRLSIKPEYVRDLERQLAEARAEIDKTYGEHCGRDFMHLPLNEAVGAVLSEARAEVERSNAGWDRANTKLIGEAMKHSNELAEARQEAARECSKIIHNLGCTYDSGTPERGLLVYAAEVLLHRFGLEG